MNGKLSLTTLLLYSLLTRRRRRRWTTRRNRTKTPTCWKKGKLRLAALTHNHFSLVCWCCCANSTATRSTHDASVDVIAWPAWVRLPTWRVYVSNKTERVMYDGSTQSLVHNLCTTHLHRHFRRSTNNDDDAAAIAWMHFVSVIIQSHCTQS